VIRVEREAEPEILSSKRVEWLEKFLAKRSNDSKARPDSSKYAHRDIKDALRRMSHGKCFYCEYRPDDGGQVDHHVEVTEDPSFAFEWTNLYLSCSQCNQAKKSGRVDRSACIDPCDPASAPDEHLTFTDEMIRPRHGSSRGRDTIRKYALDSQLLDLRRSRALRALEKARAVVRDRQIAEGGRSITQDEREILLSFGQAERPFSLMLRVALRGLTG